MTSFADYFAAPVLIGKRTVTARDIVDVAIHGAKVILDPAAITTVEASHEDLVNGLKKSSKGNTKKTPKSGQQEESCEKYLVGVPMDDAQMALLNQTESGEVFVSKCPNLSAEQRNCIMSLFYESSPVWIMRITRAAMVVRLIYIMNSRCGVRLHVATLLTGLLNHRITPLLPDNLILNPYFASENILQAMLSHAIETGDGNCYVGITSPIEQPLRTAQTNVGLSSVGLLSMVERNVMWSDSSFSPAIIAVVAEAMGGQGGLLHAIHASTALVVEALSGSQTCYDTINHDHARPHKGQCAAADCIRIFLQGSLIANGKGPALDSFIAYPQLVGPIVDQMRSTLSAILVEINSSPSNYNERFHPYPVSFLAESLTSSFSMLCQFISDRAECIMRQFSDIKLDEIPSSDFENGVALCGPINSLSSAIKNMCIMCSSLSPLFSSQSLRDRDRGNAGSAPLASLALWIFILSRAATAIDVTMSCVRLDKAEHEFMTTQWAKIQAKEKRERELTEKALAAAAAGDPAPAHKGKKKKQGDDDTKDDDSERQLKPLPIGRGSQLLRYFFKNIIPMSESSIGTMEIPSSITSRFTLSQCFYLFLEGIDPLSSRADCFDEYGGFDPALGAGIRRILVNIIEGSFGKTLKPKVAKGTIDYGPMQMAIREHVFSTITRVFKRHGGVTIDTPVFELKETLTGKYGEDTKLIYDLADQGGEMLALRYDLTVPFARYVAMHGVGSIKRYHIARVYRRDNPVISRGRFREFYQCDFDIAGSFSSGPMMPDAEVIKVLSEILDDLNIGSYIIKLNDRRILDGMLDICGVPKGKFCAICSAIDKLDKETWAEVRREMTEEKGLDGQVADKIGYYVAGDSKAGEPMLQLARLREDTKFSNHPLTAAALDDLQLLFTYLEAMRALDRVSFDLSLARGLDYYTGVIYEAVFVGTGDDTVSVGSIAAGGRYDNLIGMFNNGGQIPAVGVSIGVERVFAIIADQEERAKTRGAVGRGVREKLTQVLVSSIGSFVSERLQICADLWQLGIAAETLPTSKPNMKKQIEAALDDKIPLMVIFGGDEVAKGVVNVKVMATHHEEVVSRKDLPHYIQSYFESL